MKAYLKQILVDYRLRVILLKIVIVTKQLSSPSSVTREERKKLSSRTQQQSLVSVIIAMSKNPFKYKMIRLLSF